jgi:DNA uptake protein ComE-like DNA-binding protein
MKEGIKELLYFTPKERRGLIIVSVVISIIYVIPYFYKKDFTEKDFSYEIIELSSPSDSVSSLTKAPTESIIEIEKKIKSESAPKDYTGSGQIFDSVKETRAAELVPIDPNEATFEDLLQSGIDNFTANNFIKYRKKGASFYSYKSILKIYGMDKYEDRIESIFILNKEIKRPRKTQRKVDVNKSNLEDWTQLKGIGPVFGKRILKYRDALGGFYNLDQIKYTYGLPDSTFQAIYPYLELGEFTPKLSINKLDKKQLAAHPYIDFKQAELITKYRQMNGPIHDRRTLDELRFLSKEDIEKISPYVDYQF